MDGRTLNSALVKFYEVSFLILGSVANSLFIHLIYRRKQFRTRTSILQSIQCGFHTLCLIGLIIEDLVLPLEITKQQCYQFIMIFVFCRTAQAIIYVYILLDLLLLVKYHSFYAKLSGTRFLIVTGICLAIPSGFLTLFGYFYASGNKVVPTCKPSLAFSGPPESLFKYSMLVFCLIVLAFHITLMRMFYLNETSFRNTNIAKTMNRLQLPINVFLLTWFANHIVSILSGYIPEYSYLFDHIKFFFALSYSNILFATLRKNREYRNQFQALWSRNMRVRTSTISLVYQKTSNF